MFRQRYTVTYRTYNKQAGGRYKGLIGCNKKLAEADPQQEVSAGRQGSIYATVPSSRSRVVDKTVHKSKSPAFLWSTCFLRLPATIARVPNELYDEARSPLLKRVKFTLLAGLSAASQTFSLASYSKSCYGENSQYRKMEATKAEVQ